MIMKQRIIEYIKETPKVIIRNVKGSKKLTQPLVDQFTAEHYYRDIWIIASGSAYNAALIAKDYIRETLEVEVKVIPPSTFTNYENHIKPETFLFVVSQTGDSQNEIFALEKIKNLGRKAIGVVGEANSAFEEHADVVIDYSQGLEVEHYASESVSILATFLMLFGLETAFSLHIVDEEQMFVDKNTIKEIMYNYNDIVKDALDFIEDNIEVLSDMRVLYIMGLGANLGAAAEGAYKINERVLIPAIAMETEEYIHGPHLQLDADYTAIILDNSDHTQARTLDIYQATKVVTNKAFLISLDKNGKDKRVLNVYNPENQLFNPLVTLPVLQLIGYYVGEETNSETDLHLQEFIDVVEQNK